ncbi:MAG TPA: superoxide dismutase family protein [Candidatus Angelobacter sp.]|jgi:Cu-Zn family superoxide dismutase|nr:superoxide dismutase family protein [Candidatus Angelobacter sp.]
MQSNRTLSALLFFAMLVLLVAVPAALAKGEKAQKTVVHMKNADGKSIGTAILTPAAKGVKISLNLHGLAPGERAIHIHQNPTCEGPDFKSAGDHLNPDNKKHGLKNPEGPHAGDMPNFNVDATRHARTFVVAPGVTMGSGPNSVFTGNGTSLVIHAKADDQKSDPPTAGARIACGVIQKPK